jgi:hypothetical protein
MTATAENAVLARDAGGFAAGGVNGGRSCKGDGWADGALPSLVLWKSFLNCAPAPRKNAAILLSKSPKSVYGSFATWERGALKLLTGGGSSRHQSLSFGVALHCRRDLRSLRSGSSFEVVVTGPRSVHRLVCRDPRGVPKPARGRGSRGPSRMLQEQSRGPLVRANIDLPAAESQHPRRSAGAACDAWARRALRRDRELQCDRTVAGTQELPQPGRPARTDGRLPSARLPAARPRRSARSPSGCRQEKIKTKVDVQDSLENAPATLGRLFEGRNEGKQLLLVAE